MLKLTQREPNQKGGGCYVKEAANIDGPTTQVKHLPGAATAQRLGKQLVNTWIPAGMLQQLDNIVAETRRYPNRAEAIRMAIHDLIRTEGVSS